MEPKLNMKGSRVSDLKSMEVFRKKKCMTDDWIGTRGRLCNCKQIN